MSGNKLIGAVIATGIIALAGTVSPASAQGYGPGMRGGPGYGPGMMYGPGRREFGYGPGMMGFGLGMMLECMLGFAPDGQVSSFVDGRVAFLKAELGITDSQKSVWDAYAEAIKRNFQSMQGMRQSMKSIFEATSTTERLDAHIIIMEDRVRALKDVKPTLANLYAVLSEDQKKKADEILINMGCMM
jgi:hypothetical protein